MFFKLGIKYKKVGYHLIWINPQKDKQELFIHFISSGDMRKITLPMYKDGKVVDELSYYDHLSFHKDGKIHVRHKSSGKIKTYSRELSGTSIYNNPSSEVLPIVANTYFFSEPTRHYKKIDGKDISHIFNIDDNPFTLLIFLVTTLNADQFYNYYVKVQFNIAQAPFLFDLGDNLHQLMVIIVSDVPVELNNGYLDGQTRSFEGLKNAKPCISYGIIPTWDYLSNGLVEPERFVNTKKSKQTFQCFNFMHNNKYSSNWCIWDNNTSLYISAFTKSDTMVAILEDSNMLTFALGKQTFIKNEFKFVSLKEDNISIELSIDKVNMQPVFYIIIPIKTMSYIEYIEDSIINTVNVDIHNQRNIIVCITHVAYGKHNILKNNDIDNHIGTFCSGKYIVYWAVDDKTDFTNTANVADSSNYNCFLENSRAITIGHSPDNKHGLFLDVGKISYD